jgi:hypothetical protein
MDRTECLRNWFKEKKENLFKETVLRKIKRMSEEES